jgi:hypothetical protein
MIRAVSAIAMDSTRLMIKLPSGSKRVINTAGWEAQLSHRGNLWLWYKGGVLELTLPSDSISQSALYDGPEDDEE